MFNIKLFLTLVFICFFTKFAPGNSKDNQLNITANASQNLKETSCPQSLILNPKKYYTFSLRLTGDSLFSITIDLQSPPLRRWMKKIADTIEEYTGITPEIARHTDLFSIDENRRAFKHALIEKALPMLSVSNSERNPFPRLTSIDLGVTLDQERLGCLELSLFTSIILAEYGISNTLLFFGYHNPDHPDTPYFPPCLLVKYTWGRNHSTGAGFLTLHQSDHQINLVPINRVLWTNPPIQHIEYMIAQPEK